MNTMLCPIKVNSNTIELTMHTSFYCVQDLLCVTSLIYILVNLKVVSNFFCLWLCNGSLLVKLKLYNKASICRHLIVLAILEPIRPILAGQI